MPPSRTPKTSRPNSNATTAAATGATQRGRGRPKKNSRKASRRPPPRPSKEVEVRYHTAGDRNTEEKWDQTKLDAPNVNTLIFGPDFSIDDGTYEALIARPALCARLTSFHAGDAGTGSGSYASEATFIRFIKACPKMRLLCLDSHRYLGTDALLAIVDACPKLEALRITGHDRIRGNINDKSLAALLSALDENPSLFVQLRDLTLYDQSVSETSIRKLQKARRRLIIRVGDTERDHGYSGGNYLITYKGGKMVFGAVEESIEEYW